MKPSPRRIKEISSFFSVLAEAFSLKISDDYIFNTYKSSFISYTPSLRPVYMNMGKTLSPKINPGSVIPVKDDSWENLKQSFDDLSKLLRSDWEEEDKKKTTIKKSRKKKDTL